MLKIRRQKARSSDLTYDGVLAGDQGGNGPGSRDIIDTMHQSSREMRIWKLIRLWSGYLFFIYLLIYPTVNYALIGLATAMAGLLLRLWSAGYIMKNRELCRIGPYQYVRHPLYFGNYIVGAGVALTFANNFAIIGYLLYFFIVYILCINSEERRLRIQFGRQYDDFIEKANKFFFTKVFLTVNDFRGWRFILVLQNNEHKNFILSIVLILILAIRSY